MLEVATHAAAAATIPQSSIDADAVAASDKSDVFAGDAAADAALAAAFGGVGPLGLDASSPHFREGVPKVHEHAHSDAAMVENPFASATGRLRVSRYEYVGGYYGACHETSMLVELQKGPIVRWRDGEAGLLHNVLHLPHCRSSLLTLQAPSTCTGRASLPTRWPPT